MMSDFTMRGSSSPSSQPVSNNDNYQSQDINIDRPPRKFPRGLFNSNRSADTGPPYSTPSSPSSREPKSEQSGVPPAATKRQVFRLGRRVQKSNRSSVGSAKLIACPTLPEVDLGGPLFETTDWESVARGIGRENSNNTHHDPSSSRRDPVASKEDSTHQDMGSPTEVTPIPFANKPPTSAHGMRGARPTQSLSTGPGRLLSPHSESGHLRAPGKTETSMRTVTTLPGSMPRIGDQSALHVRPRGYSRHESSHNVSGSSSTSPKSTDGHGQHCTRSEDEEHVTFPDGSRLPLSGRRSPCGQPVPTDKSAIKLSLRDRLLEIGRSASSTVKRPLTRLMLPGRLSKASKRTDDRTTASSPKSSLSDALTKLSDQVPRDGNGKVLYPFPRGPSTASSQSSSNPRGPCPKQESCLVQPFDTSWTSPSGSQARLQLHDDPAPRRGTSSSSLGSPTLSTKPSSSLTSGSFASTLTSVGLPEQAPSSLGPCDLTDEDPEVFSAAPIQLKRVAASHRPILVRVAGSQVMGSTPDFIGLVEG